MIQAQPLPVRQRHREFQRGLRVLGAAQTLRQSVNSVIDPADQPDYDHLLKSIQESLGEDVFDETLNNGRNLPVQEATQQALRLSVTSSDVESLSTEQAAKIQFGGLSRREREVAFWIAQGNTNRDIAEIMVVHVRTVETYITRILNKLGFNSRVQIATWALEKGLSNPNQK